MITKYLYFEHPVNERMRTFLRLEGLFQQIQHFLNGTAYWNTQASTLALIELIQIVDRGDLRTDLIKELERHTTVLNNLVGTPQINTDKLHTTLEELTKHLKLIQAVQGKFGRQIRQDDLINSICQRASIANCTMYLESPAFYHWTNRPLVERRQRFHQWMSELKPLQDGIQAILTLTRDSAIFENKAAESGYYQHSLDTNYNLIRIRLPIDEPFYPEISGGKHRLNVRFLQYFDNNLRPKLVEENIKFELACCKL